MSSYENKKIDYDTHWKEIIETQFEDFIAFFLPEAYEIIDFEQPVEFLEQEFHKLIADKFKKGKVINDKLVKVFLKDGTEKWILIHIEVQSSHETDFARRMFIYFYRIFDKYEQEVTALAIYTGESVPRNYDKFEYDFLGTKNTYKFNAYQVRKAKEADLLQSDNPFALAVLATKYSYQFKGDKHKKFTFKKQLVALAEKKKYSYSQISNLLKFIFFILRLPNDLEKQFIHDVDSTFKKSENMYKLKDRFLSEHIHLLVYGESLEQYRQKIDKKVEEANRKAIEIMLTQTGLSIAEIASMIDVSQETVLAIQKKMKE
ncbi:MAG: hypothetical protein ACPG5B_05490 [Chitinophagales bacterium]